MFFERITFPFVARRLAFQKEPRWCYVVVPECCSFWILIFILVMTEHVKNRFFELVQPVRDRLVWHIYVMTKDEDEARDIVGEAIIRAFEHFHELRSEATFECFLFTIARREFFNDWKRKLRFIRLGVEHEGIASDSLHTVEIGPDIARLLHCISELPPRQRETLSLFEIGGFPLEEIRAIQGGSLSGVKSRLVRARKLLESRLNDGKQFFPSKLNEIMALRDES
jgi:RNA polymerase sigma-70 factor, ECF subfamily